MLVVADTTPLISLMKIGRLDLLEKLFQRVLAPDAVYDELTTNAAFTGEARQIIECGFVARVSVADRKSVRILREATGLDLGESEAIAYADVRHAGILLMDEMKGRRIAKAKGLVVMGTVGILIQSFYENILMADDIERALERLRADGRYISDKLIRHVREKVRAEK